MCPGGGTCCDPGLAAKAAEKYHEAGKFTGMIPHEYVEELVRRSDIVEVVGSYVQLKRPAQAEGQAVQRPVPLPQRKDPFFLRLPRDPELLLLWLRGRRGRHHLCQKDQRPELPRGGQDAGGAGRDARAGRGRRHRPDAQPHPVHEQGGGAVFPCLPELQRGRGRPGPGLLAAAWPGRPERRTGPLPLFAGQGLHPGRDGRQRAVQAQPGGADLLPVLAAGHHPHL